MPTWWVYFDAHSTDKGATGGPRSTNPCSLSHGESAEALLCPRLGTKYRPLALRCISACCVGRFTVFVFYLKYTFLHLISALLAPFCDVPAPPAVSSQTRAGA